MKLIDNTSHLLGDDLKTTIERVEAIRVKTREVTRIEARLAREEQFNKRVTINAELRTARLELERLAGTGPAGAGPGQ